MKIAVRGVGAVGAFGSGLADLRETLSGKPVIPQQVEFTLPHGKGEIPVFRADTKRLFDFVSKRDLRRVDHLSRMALLGAHLALEDGGEIDPSRTGVIVGTGYGAMGTTFGFLDTVINNGDAGASPIKFSNSVHNAPAAHLSANLSITGPNLTVSQFDFSFHASLMTAASWLESGRADSVLVGAVDEYCDVLGYCHNRFFERDETVQTILPFDLDRQTAIPGEGAFFLLLERGGEKQGAPYGYIRDIYYGRRTTTGMMPVTGVDDAMNVSDNAFLFLGLDGMRKCAEPYRRFLGVSQGEPGAFGVAAYGALCGSMPAGSGFDLVVAALSVKDGKLPDYPKVVENTGEMTFTCRNTVLGEDGEICCVKYSGDFQGCVTLA